MSEIGLNLALISVETSAWTGRVRAPVRNAQVGEETMEMVSGGKKMLTQPAVVLNDNPVFKKISYNDREKDAALTRFASPESSRGLHLVSLASAQLLLAELTAIRDRRMKIVTEEIQPIWNTVIRAEISRKYEKQFAWIDAKLPNVSELTARYDMSWVLRPLTPVGISDIPLDKLNAKDRDRIIAESNRSVAEHTRRAVESIYGNVFGGLATLCEEINSGKYFTGNRKQAAITEIIDICTRVESFGNMAPAGLISLIATTKQAVKNITASDINQSPSVQQALTKQFGGLLDVLKSDDRVFSARKAISVD